MNTEKEIPEEIQKWVDQYVNEQFPQMGSEFDVNVGAMRHAGRKTGQAIYNHLSPEIASLKAQRGAYRKALEEIEKIETYQDPQNGNIIYRSGVGMIAISALDKYPSPKEPDNAQG